MWDAVERQVVDDLRRDPKIAARAGELQQRLAEGRIAPRTAARRLLGGGDAGDATRPFRILGLQQVAIGAPDRRRLHALWVDLLGIEPVGLFASERENVDEEICAVGHGAARVEIDLMQPIDPAARPAVHEPALNHVGFWVDDLRAAVDWLTAKGLRFAPGGIRRGASGHDVCFIHPRPAEGFTHCGEGVLIELVQAPA
ncbi:MAG: VOC family protein [Sphingomonas sp.]|nr:MAG: VOC family protein [Sphingomonas sp.]